ncbi:unnamed protein product [Linum tenue]|uniref:Uncharacterized protein n=1 Tax=Linum tenue TaxID=586396 RepID=A0AAV0PSX1_9ROSI|nr:unnamed protein product [Linum tenue]
MQWWLDELKGKASYQVIHGLFKRAWNLKLEHLPTDYSGSSLTLIGSQRICHLILMSGKPF